jgi:hypothetical protein
VPNPQQPELRRSDKGSATDQDQRENQVGTGRGGGHPQGTDKGSRGGGKGGGVPPSQQNVDERISGR